MARIVRAGRVNRFCQANLHIVLTPLPLRWEGEAPAEPGGNASRPEPRPPEFSHVRPYKPFSDTPHASRGPSDSLVAIVKPTSRAWNLLISLVGT